MNGAVTTAKRTTDSSSRMSLHPVSVKETEEESRVAIPAYMRLPDTSVPPGLDAETPEQIQCSAQPVRSAAEPQLKLMPPQLLQLYAIHLATQVAASSNTQQALMLQSQALCPPEPVDLINNTQPEQTDQPCFPGSSAMSESDTDAQTTVETDTQELSGADIHTVTPEPNANEPSPMETASQTLSLDKVSSEAPYQVTAAGDEAVNPETVTPASDVAKENSEEVEAEFADTENFVATPDDLPAQTETSAPATPAAPDMVADRPGMAATINEEASPSDAAKANVEAASTEIVGTENTSEPPADLLAQDETPAPETPSEPSTAEVDSSMAAIHNEVVGRTAAIPSPKITAGTEASRRAEVIRTRAEAAAPMCVNAVNSSAAAAIPPVPTGLPDSILNVDNPVPSIQPLLEEVSNLTLADQTPPTLERTPGNNLPELGRRPLSPDILRHLQELDPETPPVGDEEKRQHDALLQMRKQLMTTPDFKPGEGEMQSLVTIPPPAHPNIPAQNRTQISKALARLLANPTGEAQTMVDRGRSSAFINNVLNHLESTAALGNDTLVTEFADILGVQFDAIRQEAGITAADMDNEISRYREQLEIARVRQEQEAQMCIDDGSAGVLAANQHVSNAIAGARTAMDEHREQVQASYGGENKRAAIEERRDRLIIDVNRHIGQQDANYRRAGETRARELDTIEAAQIAAYRYAVQQDEFQLNRNSRQIQLTPEQLAAIPPGADPVPYYIQTQVAISRIWLEDQLRWVRAKFLRLKTEASTTVTTYRDNASTAAESARTQIRDWAETAIGEEMSWLERILSMVQGWFGQAQANAQAWETVQNQETAVAASGYVDMMAQVQTAANAEITEQEMLAQSNLSAEEQAIIHAYFNPPNGGTPGDPIAAVAFGIRERVFQQRAGELKSRFESMVLDNQMGLDQTAYVDLLNGVSRAYTSDFDAWNRASRLHAAFYPGITGWGTEEEEVFSALASLNPVKAKAVRMAYQATYGESLDSALSGEMDTSGERNRARGLLEGNQAVADAAALHMAMDETFLGTGWGTDHDVIMNTLRNKNPEEVEAIISAYESTYGGNLREHLRGELDDWATLSTHDADMADAYLDSNTVLADAIAVDQSMHGFSWGYAFNLAYGTQFEAGGRDEFTAVTDRIRQEVAQDAARNTWTEAQFQAELRLRLNAVEQSYAGYTGTSLRASVTDRFASGPNRDVINATLDNDEIRADAARIASERYNSIIYASDDVITQAIERRYIRALEAAQRDHGPALRQEMNTQLLRMDEDYFARNGRYMTGTERYAAQQTLELGIERNLESLARTTAERDTHRMDTVFAESYGNAHNETLTQAVTASTSGVGETHALTALAQGGYLTRYQRFEYAVGGHYDGTEEEAAQAAIQGATQKEIEEMDARWRHEHNGESLGNRALSELSGTNAMDMTVALKGRAMTIDQAIANERLRVQLEQPTTCAGGFVAQEERGILDHHLRELERDAGRLNRPVLTTADREARDRIMDEFSVAQDALQGAVQIHRARVAAVTDAIANIASMVAAVVAGAVLSFVTLGLATPLSIALVGSLAATLTSIGTRMLLMGNQYGHEEFLNDVILGVVDAVVAAATAGLGNRLLGISQIARVAGGGAVSNGIRGTIQNIQRRLGALFARLGNLGPLTRRVQASTLLQSMSRGPWYSRLAARVMSETVENVVTSLPTAIVGAVIDDNNWRGGFQFGNALQSVGMQVGMGVGIGLSISGGMGLAHGLGSGLHRVIRGPSLGADVHFTTHEHLPTNEAQYNAARDTYLSHPNTDGTPRTAADFDVALQRERQRHLDRFLAEDSSRKPEDFDRFLCADAEARRAEFGEMHAGRKDASFDAEMGREAGSSIAKVDTEVRQRQAYREQLNAAAPEGRQGDFGDVPISILSPAEFFRLTGKTSGDTAVIVRDGQAHLLVREGASPASVRTEAAHLADITAAGTGGRVHDPHAALPSDLRGRINVYVDENMPPRSVEVHYESHNGVITGVWVQIGPGARAVDIHLHTNVMRSMHRLQGISGQVHQLLNRMRRWVGMNAAPMPGTRAFEARLELDKLPAIISERAAALRKAGTPEEQFRLMMEVENLSNQLEYHQGFINAIEAEPGIGYVAAKDLTLGQVRNNLALITDSHTQSTLAGLPIAEQQQLLHYHDLINNVAAAHGDPVVRAAAVARLIDVWRGLHSAFHAEDSSLVPRLMGRVADSANPNSVIGHIHELSTRLDSDHSKAIIRDLGYNQGTASILEYTSAIHDLMGRNLPDNLTGHLLTSALGTPDRPGFINAVTHLAGIPNVACDHALLGSIAQRMQGSASRGAMTPVDRIHFINGISDIAARANSLANKFPEFAYLTGDLVQGAVDAHRPGSFLGDPPAFDGEARALINQLDAYAQSSEATAARHLNAQADAVLADPAMAAHVAGFSFPPSSATTGAGTPRSTAEIIAAIHERVGQHELGRVVALIEHLTSRAIADPTGAGVQMRTLMANVKSLLGGLKADTLKTMPWLLPHYLRIVDHVSNFYRIVNSTHLILPGGRRISDADYDDLRDGTPTKEVRDLVNRGLAPPPFPDPALPGQMVTKNLHADHIVSMDTIARMKNFELLTRAQQLSVLNFTGGTSTVLGVHGNFVGLSEAANTSKGAKTYAAWLGHQALGVNVDPHFKATMMAEEARIAKELQNEINRLVILNGGTP